MASLGVDEYVLYRNVSIAKFEGYTQQIRYKISKIQYFKEHSVKNNTAKLLYSTDLRKSFS